MSVDLADLELLAAVTRYALAHDNPAFERFRDSIRNWGDAWIDVERTQLPVASCLDEVRERAHPSAQEMLDTFIRHRQRLRWEQSYKKEDAVVPDAMLSSYGFCEILGKQGPFVSTRIRAGIGIYGPAIEYPIHRHHPEEIYVVLAGTADFMIGAAEDLRKKPGEVIYVKSNTPHGFRTGNEALVVYYLWQGGDLREISSFER